MSETAVERRLRQLHDHIVQGLARRPDDRVTAYCSQPDVDAIDAGREALRIAREGVPRYLQNGGCSNCGSVPHTATCLVGQLAALLARCEGE